MLGKSPELASLVGAFFSARPWEQIGNEIFGLSFGDGDCLYFASVMGSGGMEYGALIVKGWEGYRLLQGMCDNDFDEHTAIEGLDFISVSLEPKEDIPPALAAYARRKNLRAVPHLGSPMVTVKGPGRVSTIPKPPQERALCSCLEALTHLARTGQFGSAGEERKGFVRIFEVGQSQGHLSAEGRWEPRPLRQPPASERRLDGNLMERLSRLPRLDRPYLVGFHAGSIAVKDQIARVLMVYDEQQDKIIIGQVFLPEKGMLDEAFQTLMAAFEGNNLLGQRGLPAEIHTDSRLLYDHFKQDLAGLGIRLLCVPELPGLTALREHFLAFLGSHRGR